MINDSEKNEYPVDKQSFENLNLSISVKDVLVRFSKKSKVYAKDIVDDLLKNHKHYAGGNAKSPPQTIPGGNEKTVEDWIQEVNLLYDQEKMRLLYVNEKVPELHGRHVILGLTALEINLGKQLMEDGFLDSIIGEVESEIEKPFTSLLTNKGKKLWLELKPPTPFYYVPNHTDDPAEEDLLGRKAFAKSLAIRLRNLRTGKIKLGAMLVHIHGPWGSGKSSFLNFLSKELHSSKGNNDNSQWVIVKFNAWQHQRLGHPWWSLMDTVFKESCHQVKDRKRAYNIRLQEWKWRLGPGLFHYSLAIIFLSIAVILFFWVNETKSVESANNYVVLFSGIIALIGAISSGALGLSQSLLPGSARAASTFMESTNGPLQSLKDHFCDMMENINHPVAIFIDDLDRCQVDYTVGLLEGIQTLFRETEVTYLVAADKRWLCTSYEKAYNDFINTVNEPGRPLGHLFMEKTFQFTVPLPRLSSEQKKDYLQHLLNNKRSGRQKDQGKATNDAQKRLAELRTEKEITEELKTSSNDPVYDLAIREAAIVRLAESDVQENTEEHILKKFAKFMEPNPRAMKRFVNSYGIQLAVDIMRGGKMETTKIGLWTIVLLRWPLMAEFLEEHPEMVNFIGNKSIPEDRIPENLKKLFQDSELIDVIKGKDLDGMLDEDTIRDLNYPPEKNPDDKQT